MSYYNRNNRGIDEFQSEFDSPPGQQQDEQFHHHQQQQPPPPPLDPRFATRQNDYTKRYNDLLERQGIPAISPQDMAIITACNRESFYYRCLPISAALCAGIVYLARTNLFRPRFYHYFGAVFVGYFTGKISYRSVCEERLINSRSNSPFVNAIRKRRGLFLEEFDQASQVPSEFVESDWNMPQAESTTTYGGSEFDNESKPLSSPYRSQGQPTERSSYDDLRAANRSTYKNV